MCSIYKQMNEIDDSMSLKESTLGEWESADYYDVRQLPVGTKIRVTDTDISGEDFTVEVFFIGGDRDSDYIRVTRDESSRFDSDSRYYEEVDIDCVVIEYTRDD